MDIYSVPNPELCRVGPFSQPLGSRSDGRIASTENHSPGLPDIGLQKKKLDNLLWERIPIMSLRKGFSRPFSACFRSVMSIVMPKNSPNS
jgi:hypothetical protein